MSNLTHRPIHLKPSKADKKADRQYLDWLRSQPCCYCGKAPPSDPAHVRLAGRGGMGMKPMFSAVALCHTDHLRQHQHGHSEMMSDEEWLFLADQYLERWKQEK